MRTLVATLRSHPGYQPGSPDAAHRSLSLLRWGAILLLAALSLVGAAGLTAHALFTQPTTLKYLIKSGDTLFGIALRFHTTVDAIMAANPQITNPNLIRDGETLNIP